MDHTRYEKRGIYIRRLDNRKDNLKSKMMAHIKALLRRSKQQ